MSLQRDPIVVGLTLHDENDTAALRFASELAALTGARLVLLHAHPFEPLIAVPPPKWEREQRMQLHARLEDAATPLRPRVDVSVEVKASPSAVRALHEAAEELGASLLVAGATHRAGIGAVVPGGVAERLLHAAPCAVAIVPPAYAIHQLGLRRIGVAFIDGPEGRDALAVATGLARQAGATVTTYTVRDRGATWDPGAVLERARQSVPEDVLAATELLDGDAADQLTRVSGDLDLLICGSRGYGPVRSTLIGGVSSRLAHTAACPLLVIPRAPVPGLATLTVAAPTR